VTLSRAEFEQFRARKGGDRRVNDWLFGRIVAKDAVRTLWQRRHGERTYPADLEVQPDAHGRPVIRHRASALQEVLPSVSIAHTEGTGAALATFGPAVGIDVERVKARAPGFEEIAFDEEERSLLHHLGPDRAEAVTRFWCAKEAVAKALGRGLVEGPRSLAV